VRATRVDRARRTIGAAGGMAIRQADANPNHGAEGRHDGANRGVV